MLVFRRGKKLVVIKIQKTVLMVFNLNRITLKTLETEYKLSDFCYDEDNNRLILSLNDEIQFAYLDLDGII